MGAYDAVLKSLDSIQRQQGAIEDVPAQKRDDLCCNSERLYKSLASSSLISLVWISYYAMILIQSHLLSFLKKSKWVISQGSTIRIWGSSYLSDPGS